MAYYSSETCGEENSEGCTASYASSDIKYVVDGWKTVKAPEAIEARLIKKEEIETESKEVDICGGKGCMLTLDAVKYAWMYNNNYSFWTMSQYNNSTSNVWSVRADGLLRDTYVNNLSEVRPVIVLLKSLL